MQFNQPVPNTISYLSEEEMGPGSYGMPSISCDASNIGGYDSEIKVR